MRRRLLLPLGPCHFHICTHQHPISARRGRGRGMPANKAAAAAAAGTAATTIAAER